MLLTLGYCLIGLVLALPLSYYFQSSIYSEMSLSDYLRHSDSVIAAGAEFGSIDAVRYTTFATILVCLLLGRFIERQIMRHRKKTSSKNTDKP